MAARGGWNSWTKPRTGGNTDMNRQTWTILAALLAGAVLGGAQTEVPKRTIVSQPKSNL